MLTTTTGQCQRHERRQNRSRAIPQKRLGPHSLAPFNAALVQLQEPAHKCQQTDGRCQPAQQRNPTERARHTDIDSQPGLYAPGVLAKAEARILGLFPLPAGVHQHGGLGGRVGVQRFVSRIAGLGPLGADDGQQVRGRLRLLRRITLELLLKEHRLQCQNLNPSAFVENLRMEIDDLAIEPFQLWILELCCPNAF